MTSRYVEVLAVGDIVATPILVSVDPRTPPETPRLDKKGELVSWRPSDEA